MGRQIADCYREFPAGHFDEGENAANAQLIAAAPDLLACLHPNGNPSISKMLRSHGYIHEADNIDAAVAKAQGTPA